MAFKELIMGEVVVSAVSLTGVASPFKGDASSLETSSSVALLHEPITGNSYGIACGILFTKVKFKLLLFCSSLIESSL